MNGLFVKDRGFYRSLLALALPICLQNFLTYGVALADNVMVGQLGETALGGLYVGTVVYMVLMNIVFGVTQAATILTAQYWGARRLDPIRDIAAMTLRGTSVVGFAFAAVAVLAPNAVAGLVTDKPDVAAAGAAYLRMVGPSYLLFAVSQTFLLTLRTVEIVSIGLVNAAVALLLNIVLNWALIFGHAGCPALGVRGAALATVLARAVELALVAGYAFFADRRLLLRPRDLRRRNPALLRDLVRYGTPLMLGQAVWAVNQFGRGFFVGHMAPASIASASIADTVDGLVWMLPLGFAIACGILTGKTIGEGRLEAMKGQARTMQAVFLAIGAATALALWTARPLILRSYGIAPSTVPVARAFLAVITLTAATRCYQAPALMGLVKAGGDTAFVFLNDTFWVFCWVLPGAFVAQRILHAPDWAVYAMLLSDQVTKCAVAAVKVNRFHWIKRLVAQESEREGDP